MSQVRGTNGETHVLTTFALLVAGRRILRWLRDLGAIKLDNARKLELTKIYD